MRAVRGGHGQRVRGDGNHGDDALDEVALAGGDEIVGDGEGEAAAGGAPDREDAGGGGAEVRGVLPGLLGGERVRGCGGGVWGEEGGRDEVRLTHS